jgi:YD repeat-containing protein
MALEEIGWYRREEFPYILAVRTEESRETRTLLYEGQELRRWEHEADEQRIYRGSELEQRLRYDSQNRLIEDRLYSGGLLSSRTAYYYSRDVLERTETFGPDGLLLYRDFYKLSPDGQLRRVTREDPQQQQAQRLALGEGARGAGEERYGDSREQRINRYDRQGRLVEREHWYGGQLMERERFAYRGEEDILERSRLEEFSPERTTRRSYDAEGRVVLIEATDRDGRIERTVHVRDGQGRIVETTRRGPGGIENWLFEYDAGKEPVREEYRVRGSLERVTLYSAEGEERLRVEELYRDGRLFMRVHYRSGQKVKEEVLKNGEVVRVREYR